MAHLGILERNEQPVQTIHATLNCPQTRQTGDDSVQLMSSQEVELPPGLKMYRGTLKSAKAYTKCIAI